MDVIEPVSGLSSKRAIEFHIDLVAGAELVSSPPSRMSPIKMKELKVQLVELEGNKNTQNKEFPLWRNRMGGILGTLECKFHTQHSAVG